MRGLVDLTWMAEAFGKGAHAAQLDVTDAESITGAALNIGELDILVDNAGINPGGEDIAGTTLERLRRVYETNVFGLIAVPQAFLPALRRSAHPRIVNISRGNESLEWNSGPNPRFDRDD